MAHPIEEAIERIAGRQHGLITRGQLRETGLGAHAIDYRAKRGLLHRVHRSVYRLGPLVAPRAPEMAAVLACGPAAVVSHASAGALWDLWRGRSAGEPVEVTVPCRHRRRHAGVLVHCAPDLLARERTTLEGIPVTTPVRTLVDLAGKARSREMERALARADRKGLVSRRELTAAMARRPRRPGGRLLASLLEAQHGPKLTRSHAEDRFLDLVGRGGLEAPEANVRVSGHEVDFVWRDAALIVEVDGYEFHRSRTSFEADRRRDAELAAAGFRVLRLTWSQIVDRPEMTLVQIARSLAAGSVSSRPPAGNLHGPEGTGISGTRAARAGEPPTADTSTFRIRRP